MNLECDSGVKITILTVLTFASNWAGSLFFNVLGDKYGRLKISKIGFLLACALYVPYFFPLVYPVVVIYMFLFGFINAYYIQAYILGVEFTSNENRDFYTIVA
jgi:MFS family permease